MPFMTLEEYLDRFGANLDELAIALMHRANSLDPVRVRELLRVLQPEGKTAPQNNLLNLIDEARENLELARKLRDSVTGAGGELLGNVSEVSKVIMAVDRALESASKRFQAIYSVTSLQAVEECVKDTLAEMDEEASERFMARLESRLKSIR